LLVNTDEEIVWLVALLKAAASACSALRLNLLPAEAALAYFDEADDGVGAK